MYPGKPSPDCAQLRCLTTALLLLFVFLSANAQEDLILPVETGQKGRIYMYWGWNRAAFTKSNISFKGRNYDFTIKKVVAKDKPTAVALDPYFNPSAFTIPQYNFRIGYFFNDHWNASFGVDHMKYVMQTNQTAKISGYIDLIDSEYNGVYNDDEIVLSEDFLAFEHTDGLNFVNIDIRRFDWLFKRPKFKIGLTEGVGFGALIPKTKTSLLGMKTYDAFHWSGYGLSGMVGVNFRFFDFLFIQSEFKGGYLNLPAVRTTQDTADKASHSLWFGQMNIVFGGTVRLGKR